MLPHEFLVFIAAVIAFAVFLRRVQYTLRNDFSELRREVREDTKEIRGDVSKLRDEVSSVSWRIAKMEGMLLPAPDITHSQ